MALLPVLLDMVDEIYSNLDNPEKTLGDIPMLFVPHCRRNRGCPRKQEHGHGHHGDEHKHGHHGDEHKHGHHGHYGHGSKHEEGHETNEKHEEGRRHCGRKQKHGHEGGPCRFRESRRGHCPYRGFSSCPRFGGRGGCPCKKTSSDDFKVAFDVKCFNPDEISVKVKGREVFVDGKHDEREDEYGFVSRQFTRRYEVPAEYDVDTVATYLDGDGKMTITASKPKPVVDESTERIIPIERVASVQDEITEALGTIDLMEDDTTDSKADE